MAAFPRGASQRGAAAAAVTHREQCRQADAAVLPLVLKLHAEGKSLRAIAAALTAAGIPTRQGFRRWHARQVSRILSRAAIECGTIPANPDIAPPIAEATTATAPPQPPAAPPTAAAPLPTPEPPPATTQPPAATQTQQTASTAKRLMPRLW